jgi:DNA-binding transcriptional regulator YdaS (Cro superfamily)
MDHFCPEAVQAVKRACSLVGGQAPLASAVGVTVANVSHWATGYRRVPAERAIAVERVTSGQVRVEELRPDIDWSVVRRPKDA